MTIRSTGQNWALDIALAQGGFDALHPQAKGTMEQLGHDHTDFDNVFALVRSGAMLPKAWATIAAQAEERVMHEAHGFVRTASDLYERAAVMWGRAQYSIFDAADARKTAFLERTNHCVERLAKLRDNRVRRIVLDFEGAQIYGLLHLPAGPVVKASAVILGPGMDMIKEDYIHVAERYYTDRGMVALSIEGRRPRRSPRQRPDGGPDQLRTRDQPLRRLLDGFARGGPATHWHLRHQHERLLGLTRRRDRSSRGGAGRLRSRHRRFPHHLRTRAATFKNNYMFMTGYTDEAAFDRDMASQMPLGDLVERIGCPVLYGIGEFDELTPLDQALISFEKISAPKELRVYEDEFHPLGGVAAEMFRFAAEWLERALNGELAAPGRDVRCYVHRDGRTTDGAAHPTWWLDTAPTQ